MPSTSAIVDRSRDMEAKSWWDLWNTSHRTKDDNDATSSELFTRTATVVNEITARRDSRLLEVACGTGSFSRKLVYSKYHGLDLSPAAIGLAWQKSRQMSLPLRASPPTYEAADFHEWPAPAEEYDMVLCVDAIAYFEDQQLCVHKMAQCLRTSGTLVLTTINPFVYDRIRRNEQVRLESGPVNHCLSRRELHGIIERAGLHIERSYTIMPRGEMGILRIANSLRLNKMLGSRGAAVFKRLKEHAGLGQYRVVIARKMA